MGTSPLVRSALTTRLLRFLTARLERSRGLLPTLRGNLLLLVGIHASKATFMTGLTALLSDILHLLLRTRDD